MTRDRRLRPGFMEQIMSSWLTLLRGVGEDFRQAATAWPSGAVQLVFCWIPPGESPELCQHPAIAMVYKLNRASCRVRERRGYDDSGASEWFFLLGDAEPTDQWKNLALSAVSCLPADDFPPAAVFRSQFPSEPCIGGSPWGRWASFVFRQLEVIAPTSISRWGCGSQDPVGPRGSHWISTACNSFYASTMAIRTVTDHGVEPATDPASVVRVVSSNSNRVKGPYGLLLDTSRHAVTRGDHTACFEGSFKPWMVLLALAKKHPAYFSTNDLIREVWGESAESIEDHTLRVTVAKTRKLIRNLHVTIGNTRGLGYRIEEESQVSDF
jgi:hypothetical protein